MSDYGNPYGQQPNPDPWYMQQGYDPQYGYGTPYGPPGVPHAPADTSGAVAALVCNIVAVLFCCNVLCIGGIVTSAIALSKANTEPEQTRTLTMWSWVIVVVSVLLQIALIGVLIVIGVVGSDDSSGGGPGI